MKRFYILFFIVSLSLYSRGQGTLIPPAAEVKILKYFPNPATSQITFNFERIPAKDFSFQIFNFIGKKVFESQSLSATTVVSLTDFYRGFYIFQLRDKSGHVVESGKFQVTK